MISKSVLKQYIDLQKEIDETKERINRTEKQLAAIEKSGTVIDSVTGGMGGIQRYKIEGFPYAEYGTLSGIVETISLNPIEKYYLVHISLPNGLVSSTGSQLFFAETLYGQAEIITQERRLISRIFNKIYEMFNNKKSIPEDNKVSKEQSQITF